MADSNEHFQKLEERLLKAIDLFKRTRAEKRALQQELEKLRADFNERAKLAETMERELVSLRREREEVRTRVEKLLHQIDVLTTTDSET